MVEFSEFFGAGRNILILGAILLYVASRVGARELEGEERSPGRRAIGNWVPIAAAVMVALAIHRADWALSIIFATSVGCLSLLFGSIAMVSNDYDIPATERRFWPFILPAALLTLLVGFAGNVSWRNAGLLLIEGLVLFYAWQEAGSPTRVGAAVNRKLPLDFRWVNSGLCIAMSVVGAVAAVIGTKKISANAVSIPGATIVVSILAPLLILPMLTGGADLAKKHRTSEAFSGAIAVVLLNLCLLLPVMALLWYPANALTVSLTAHWQLNIAALRDTSPMPFGWVTWRVDNVLLLVLTIALFPVALGRWKLGKSEGLALVALYGAYVLLETFGSIREM